MTVRKRTQSVRVINYHEKNKSVIFYGTAERN